MAMTGLPERTARRVLSSLLDWGLLTSASSRAPGRLRRTPGGVALSVSALVVGSRGGCGMRLGRILLC